MEVELQEYLRQLGVDEDAISTMEEQKLDIVCISTLSDDQLSVYLTKIGDRIKLKLFCERKKLPLKKSRKSELLDRLQGRLAKAKEHEMDNSENPELPGNDNDKSIEKGQSALARKNNTNAAKKARQIQLGWLDYSKGVKRLIPEKEGGGKRNAAVLKSSTKAEVLEIGKKYYFPNGKSQIGDAAEFQFGVASFDEEEMEVDDTIGEIYARTGFPQLRLYLTTHLKNTSNDPQITANSDTDNELPPFAQGSVKKGVTVKNKGFKKIKMRQDIANIEEEQATPGTSVQTSENETVVSSSSILQEACRISGISESIEESFDVDQKAVFQDIVNNFDPEIAFSGADYVDSEDQTLPLELGFKTIVLRRGNVLEGMLEWFVTNEFDLRNDTLHVTMIRANGTREKGEDSGGIFRDALSEFWQTFYLKYTMGEGEMKVPVVVHTMTGAKWEAVAQVLVIGYKQAGYFPMQLSAPFMQNCINGSECSHDELLKYFMLYLSSSDRTTIKAALADFDAVDVEDIQDSLADMSVKTVISKDNFRNLLIDVAHTELIQKPAFVSKTWRPILVSHLSPLLQLPIQELYEKLTPTTKKVLNVLHFPITAETNQSQKVVKDALRKYVKGMNEATLGKFLCYCTGSDVLVVENIDVQFIQIDTECVRRPIAHTCGNMLELPSGENGYDGYLMLREEFNNILESGYLEMDII